MFTTEKTQSVALMTWLVGIRSSCLLICCVTVGCSDETEITTTDGLQDQIVQRDEHIDSLKETIEDLEVRIKTDRNNNKERLASDIASLKELHGKEIAHLNSIITDLKFKLKVETEARILSEDALNSAPRIEKALENRHTIWLVFFFVVIVILVFIAGMYAMKLREVRKEKNSLAMKGVAVFGTRLAELRRLEAK